MEEHPLEYGDIWLGRFGRRFFTEFLDDDMEIATLIATNAAIWDKIRISSNRRTHLIRQLLSFVRTILLIRPGSNDRIRTLFHNHFAHHNLVSPTSKTFLSAWHAFALFTGCNDTVLRVLQLLAAGLVPVRTLEPEKDVAVLHTYIMDPRVRWGDFESLLFRVAAQRGATYVVEDMLRHPQRRSTFRPDAVDNFALRYAVRHGHSGVVSQLIRETSIQTLYSSDAQWFHLHVLHWLDISNMNMYRLIESIIPGRLDWKPGTMYSQQPAHWVVHK
jgi:hypothetical protein